MSPRKSIPDLTYLTFDPASRLIKDEALRIANFAVTHFTLEEVENDRQMYLSDQVEATKIFIIGHIPPLLIEPFLTNAVMVGICEAVISKKREWSPACNRRKFGLELNAIIKFCNLLVHPLRRALDLASVPQVIRTRLYGSLTGFQGLHTLILGSGSGGWVPEAYAFKFLRALPKFNKLQHFSLKYDCTEHVLKVLSESCSESLRLLDVERCLQVKDQICVDYILSFKNLIELNIFKTGLEDSEICQILVALKNILHLPRGDFLCDVLEYLDDEVSLDIQFEIQNFWASEDYFFHSEEQMLLVAKYCPKIRTAMFMFRDECCTNMLVLSNFNYLKDLDLWGGKFYTDGIIDFLHTCGHQLEKLSLVHVEEIDKRAIAIITSTCTNLHKLGFQDAEFIDDPEQLENDAAFRDADRLLRYETEKEINALLRPMLDLHTLKVIGTCSANLLTFILSFGLNVKHISLGTNTEISDNVWENVLEDNRLAHLETLAIQKSGKSFTVKGIELLILSCDKLKVLKDPTSFEGVHENEVKILKLRIREENLDLRLEEEPVKLRDPSGAELTRDILNRSGRSNFEEFFNSP